MAEDVEHLLKCIERKLVFASEMSNEFDQSSDDTDTVFDLALEEDAEDGEGRDEDSTPLRNAQAPLPAFSHGSNDIDVAAILRRSDFRLQQLDLPRIPSYTPTRLPEHWEPRHDTPRPERTFSPASSFSSLVLYPFEGSGQS